DSELDQAGVLLERGAEEHLTRQEQHNEFRCRVELLPVALAPKGDDMVAHLAGVVGEVILASLLIVDFGRSQVCLHGGLCIDYESLSARKPDDQVRSQPAV